MIKSSILVYALLTSQVCETRPLECEDVIRKQGLAIEVLSLRLRETNDLLKVEMTKTSSLTEIAVAPSVPEEYVPWWAYVLAVAGAVALGAGVATATR